LLDQFVQSWQTSLSDSSKALNYRIFKTKFEFEEYFNILNIGDAIRLCRFRTTNHYLPIETGTTVGKPGVQKILLICLINIHNFHNSDCFLVDRSSKNLTTLCLFKKYFGRSCLRLSFKEEHFLNLCIFCKKSCYVIMLLFFSVPLYLAVWE
jgi:hypothetical protein